MTLQRQRMSVEQFDIWIERPDNQDRLWEYVGGELVDVPSNPFASMIAALFLAELIIYLKEHDIGYVTGADGGYQVMGERYAPDVAFISYAKQPTLPKRGYNPNPPDLAIEVVSNENSATELDTLMTKVANFVAAGTVVWVAYPQAQVVKVHTPLQPIRIIERDEVLDGGDILPHFELPLSRIFRHDA